METLNYTNLYKLDRDYSFCIVKKNEKIKIDKCYDLKHLENFYKNHLSNNENIIFVKDNNIMLYEIKKKIFNVKKTETPDTYEIDDESKNLSIINLRISKEMNKIFENCDEREIECEYYEKYKKWIPIV